MKIYFKNSFIKDINKLPEPVKTEARDICFSEFPKLNSLNDFQGHNIKKLSGFAFYYRIKLGNYRIGFKKTNGDIIFMRVLHRKDIYRFFP